MTVSCYGTLDNVGVIIIIIVIIVRPMCAALIYASWRYLCFTVFSKQWPRYRQ